ncbi:MAG: hypothetical protein EOM20_20650 [Spartobacteria bacterium]|nr:hypothetical protein [Spartobacteria bacterium]
MSNQLKERMSVFKGRYQTLIHTLTIVPILTCLIAALWLSLHVGEAMGLTSGVAVRSHPHGNLWLLTMYSLAVGGLAVGAIISMQLHVLAQCPHHNWSWSKAKDAVDSDTFPKHWYKVEPKDKPQQDKE